MKMAPTNHRMLLLVVSLCLVICAAHNARAQESSGGGFVLTSQVIAGGGDSSAGGAFSVTGTIAQHDAATSTGGAFTFEGGFWSTREFWSARGLGAPPKVSGAIDVTALLTGERGGFHHSLVTSLYARRVIPVTQKSDRSIASPVDIRRRSALPSNANTLRAAPESEA